MVSWDHGTMASFEHMGKNLPICLCLQTFRYFRLMVAGFECFEWFWTSSTQKPKLSRLVNSNDFGCIITMVVSHEPTAHPGWPINKHLTQGRSYFFFVWFSSSEHQGPTKLKHQIGSSKLIESSNLGIKNFEPYLWPHLFNCSTFFDHWPKTRPRKGIKRT